MQHLQTNHVLSAIQTHKPRTQGAQTLNTRSIQFSNHELGKIAVQAEKAASKRRDETRNCGPGAQEHQEGTDTGHGQCQRDGAIRLQFGNEQDIQSRRQERQLQLAHAKSGDIGGWGAADKFEDTDAD